MSQFIFSDKLINNSSSLNKGNHDLRVVWIIDPNILAYIDFYDFFSSVFSSGLVSIEKMY